MTDSLCQFFTWAVRDVIFSSGDVQTTTIAVAITSSLCCSIVVAVVHVMTLILPRQRKNKKVKKCHRTMSNSTISTKKGDSSMWISSGKVHVPCVKCGNFFADDGCRFVTCKSCCFSVLSCQIHQKKSLSSKPCDNKQTVMDLSSIGMQACPDRLGFVGAQLTWLNLADNQLTDLPPEIGCLRGLQQLSLKHNKLTVLPSTLCSLTHLTMFDISHNQFKIVPESIHTMSQLQDLNMSYNQMSHLPPEISRLKQLQTLNISFNKIVLLCSGLFDLFHLKSLVLMSNPIKHIPCAIGNLVKLNSLDARSCDLTSLPVSIGKCSNLVCLKLDNNRLRKLPSQVGQLGHLHYLLLSDNNLQHLPAMLYFLPDEIVITVHGNPLLTQDVYTNFTQIPDRGPSLFPSLKELSAREIIKRNIPDTHTLPSMLENMLKSPGFCSKCGGPLFEFYSSKILPWHFLFGNVDWIPLYQQLCSPHQPEGCG